MQKCVSKNRTKFMARMGFFFVPMSGVDQQGNSIQFFSSSSQCLAMVSSSGMVSFWETDSIVYAYCICFYISLNYCKVVVATWSTPVGLDEPLSQWWQNRSCHMKWHVLAHMPVLTHATSLPSLCYLWSKNSDSFKSARTG